MPKGDDSKAEVSTINPWRLLPLLICNVKPTAHFWFFSTIQAQVQALLAQGKPDTNGILAKKEEQKSEDKDESAEN